jgi:hypothetical protein
LKNQKNQIEGFALFDINKKELAQPHPYRPARETKQGPYNDRPYTAYMDFRDGTEEDMLEDDDDSSNDSDYVGEILRKSEA